MTEPPLLQRTRTTLENVPESCVATGWRFSRHDWQQLIADRDALAGGVAYTADPEHPTLHGLPVTVDRDMASGYVIAADNAA